ncbi:unnamed protein product [Mucor hiemalis]
MVKEVTSTTQSETRYKIPVITLPAPRRPNVDQLSLLTDLNLQQDTSSATTFSTLIAPAPYRTRFSNNPRFDLGPYLSHSKQIVFLLTIRIIFVVRGLKMTNEALKIL